MSEVDKIRQAISARPLFKDSRESFIATLAGQGRIIKANKGQVLFMNMDDADKFFIVIGGWVKLYRETIDGAQAVVDILSAGHMFGETSIFENDTYPYSAEATESAEIIVLPLSVLKTEIDESPSFARAMLSAMARYRTQQDRELEHRTLQNASQRIGCFLLRLANQDQQGQVVISLPYDKSLVASRLGMQPETFSRALSKLKKATGMEVSGGKITIGRLEDLSEYCCSACSSSFPCKDIA